MAYHVQNSVDFEAQLTRAAERLVVVNFRASWSPQCRAFDPTFNQVASEERSHVFLIADVDKCKQIKDIYAITEFPTFVYIRDKMQVDSFTGANEDQLRYKIKCLR